MFRSDRWLLSPERRKDGPSGFEEGLHGDEYLTRDELLRKLHLVDENKFHAKTASKFTAFSIRDNVQGRRSARFIAT